LNTQLYKLRIVQTIVQLTHDSSERLSKPLKILIRHIYNDATLWYYNC